jgi:hypothetical protein
MAGTSPAMTMMGISDWIEALALRTRRMAFSVTPAQVRGEACRWQEQGAARAVFGRPGFPLSRE